MNKTRRHVEHQKMQHDLEFAGAGAIAAYTKYGNQKLPNTTQWEDNQQYRKTFISNDCSMIWILPVPLLLPRKHIQTRSLVTETCVPCKKI